MKASEFSLLSRKQQLNVLYKNGIYIGKRNDDGAIIVLYQQDTFYVEIFYTQYRRYIGWMEFSETTDVLDPYLETMDLVDLVE